MRSLGVIFLADVVGYSKMMATSGGGPTKDFHLDTEISPAKELREPSSDHEAFASAKRGV